MNRDTKIAILIYLATLGILLCYNLTHPPVNDGVKEYEAYLLNIKDNWIFRRTLVNSCLVTTWLPAMLQKQTGVDQMVLFRIFPTIFYALMPVFTYLIARRYLAIRYALIACLVVILNSHILFFPDMGRVGVGIAFFAGMIWALLEKRLVWAMVFALLVTFSHYGTALIAMGLTFACVLGYLVWQRKLLRKYLVVFCLLLVSIGVWHFWISSYSGWVMLTYGIQTDMPMMTGDAVGPEIGWDKEAFLDLSTREIAVQRALGLIGTTIPEMIEIVANWLMVGTITLGLFLLLRKWQIDDQFKIMGASLWLLIIFTVAVPWLSQFYGGMRVYFTALPVLAIAFPVGMKWVAEKVRIQPILLCGLVLVLLAVSTSGIVYRPFGQVKAFPIYFNVENLEAE